MDFEGIKKSAIEIKNKYREIGKEQGYSGWGASDYVQGLMGDLGDLAKLIMAKNKLRKGEDIDNKVEHELADCLWSIIVIADELDVDLEKAFSRTMRELTERLKN